MCVRWRRFYLSHLWTESCSTWRYWKEPKWRKRAQGLFLVPQAVHSQPLGKHAFPSPEDSTLSESSLLFPLWWIFLFEFRRSINYLGLQAKLGWWHPCTFCMAFLKGNHLALLNLFIPGLLSRLVRCGSHRESQNHQYFRALIKVSREPRASCNWLPFPKQVPGVLELGGTHREMGVWLKLGMGSEGPQDFIRQDLPDL